MKYFGVSLPPNQSPNNMGWCTSQKKRPRGTSSVNIKPAKMETKTMNTGSTRVKIIEQKVILNTPPDFKNSKFL